MKGDISVSQHLETSFWVPVYYFLSQNITQVLDTNISAEEAEEEETWGVNKPKSLWVWVGPECE